MGPRTHWQWVGLLHIIFISDCRNHTWTQKVRSLFEPHVTCECGLPWFCSTYERSVRTSKYFEKNAIFAFKNSYRNINNNNNAPYLVLHRPWNRNSAYNWRKKYLTLCDLCSGQWVVKQSNKLVLQTAVPDCNMFYSSNRCALLAVNKGIFRF